MKSMKFSAIVGLLLGLPMIGYCGVLSGSADLTLGQADFTHNANNVVDGQGFNNPYHLSIDTHTGRVYVSDFSNSRVLWWNNIDNLTNGKTADGVVGQPDLLSNAANRGGSVAANTLNRPYGAFVDPSGNLWVADSHNNRVLKYKTPSSNGPSADLVLGQADFTSNSINRGGSVAANTIYYPHHIFVDSLGNLWVGDTANNRILKFNTPSSNGPSADLVLGQADFTSNSINRGGSVAANTLYEAHAVFVDSSNYVWAADFYNNRVLKYDLSSSTSNAVLVIGQPDFTSNSANRGGSAAANTLYYPHGVTISSSGYLWVADVANNRALKYDLSASTSNAILVLGQADLTSGSANRGGNVAANTLYRPVGIALDPSGNVWVSEYSNHRVLKFNQPSSNGVPADLVLGQADFLHNGINLVDALGVSAPYDVAVDTTAGRIYVADTNNHRILWWNDINSLTNAKQANGVLGQADLSSYASNRGASVSTHTLSNPRGLTVDSSGRLWVADFSNNRVLKYDLSVSTSNAVLVLGQPDFISGTANRGGSAGAHTLYFPHAVAVSSSGHVWVAESGNHRVLQYDLTASTSNAVLVLGQTDFASNSANRGGTAAANSLYYPTKITLDGAGNVWVADASNNRVLKYVLSSSTSNAALVLGQGDLTTGSINRGGSVAANSLNYPSGVFVDSSSSVWVADASNNRVLKYAAPSTSGVAADQVTGQINFATSTANRGGAAADNTLNNPSGVFLDLSGNLWAVDTSNNRILKYNSTFQNQTVSPSTGSTLALDAVTGTITVELPAGAFSQAVTINVSTTAAPSSDRAAIKTTAIAVSISNTQGLQPSKDLTLTINYRDADVTGLNESDLIIARYDTATGRYLALPSTPYPSLNKITARADHLSTFTLAIYTAAPDIAGVKVYPNPFNPKKVAALTIDNLTSEASIKIFTITGELVRSVSYTSQNGRATWDGRNDSGNLVASGVYFALIESDSGKKVIKIAVEK